MAVYKNTSCVSHSLEELMPIVSISDNGSYALRLPNSLKADQIELEIDAQSDFC